MNLVNVWIGILKSTKGRFFSISFYKKDGTIRNLNGKVDGGFVVDITNHVTVWDAKKRAFRKVNLERIQHYKCGQVEI